MPSAHTDHLEDYHKPFSGLFAVHSPHLIPCIPFYFLSLLQARISGEILSPKMPGIFNTAFPHRELYKETNGSPEFPRQPCEYMPWSDPGGDLTLAIAYPSLLPSGFQRLSAFTSILRSYHETTILDFSGLNTEPASLIHLASDSRYRAYPQTSLLTCRLGFGQVGLVAIAATHPLVRNNQFHPERDFRGCGFISARQGQETFKDQSFFGFEEV